MAKPQASGTLSSFSDLFITSFGLALSFSLSSPRFVPKIALLLSSLLVIHTWVPLMERWC